MCSLLSQNILMKHMFKHLFLPLETLFSPDCFSFVCLFRSLSSESEIFLSCLVILVVWSYLRAMPHKSDKKLWSRGEACHLGAISLRSAQCCWYVKTFLLGWLDSSEENLLTFSLDGGKRVTICSAAELEKPFGSGWTQYIKCSFDPPVCRLVLLSPHPTPTPAPLPPGQLWLSSFLQMQEIQLPAWTWGRALRLIWFLKENFS